MHAVAVELHREVGPVVHEEGHAALLADRPQGVGGAGDGGVVDALQAQLEGRDIAAVQRRPSSSAKIAGCSMRSGEMR